MKKRFRPLRFPQDESVHNHSIEWWYFNGHVRDKSGNAYSYMNCLFRMDVKRVGIPLLRAIPLATSYFSHSLISDLQRRTFQHRIAPLSILSDDSHSKPLLSINYINPAPRTGYTNCVIEKLDASRYHMKNEDLDVTLTAMKQPLLEGGSGFLDLRSKSTYCYSITNLATEGRMRIGAKWVTVSGVSWMDHQWANTKYTKDKWDWFSIQLDNNTELVCFVYDSSKGRTFLADICYPDGRQAHFDDVAITPLERRWVSPKSGAAYPTAWCIVIPAICADLHLEARIDNQEMLFGSINYWEGPLLVNGSIGDEPVRGVGFMELLGYASTYSNAQYVRDAVNHSIGRATARTLKGASSYIGRVRRSIAGRSPALRKRKR
ncbi:MAG: hypothetical protein NDJ92_03540 [Thermoanaerobaculia bacterium]|nr:hypothetical protein [Thermoanaerobaculia bacterium]